MIRSLIYLDDIDYRIQLRAKTARRAQKDTCDSYYISEQL